MRGHCIGRRSIEGGGLIKCDIPRDTDAPNNRIVATIPLMLETVTKEDTGGGLSSELGPLPRKKQEKTSIAKDSQMIIARWCAVKTLTRATTVNKK